MFSPRNEKTPYEQLLQYILGERVGSRAINVHKFLNA